MRGSSQAREDIGSVAQRHSGMGGFTPLGIGLLSESGLSRQLTVGSRLCDWDILGIDSYRVNLYIIVYIG